MSKPCFRMATIGVAFMQQHEDTAASQFVRDDRGGPHRHS